MKQEIAEMWGRLLGLKLSECDGEWFVLARDCEREPLESPQECFEYGLQMRNSLALDAIAHMHESVIRRENQQAFWVFVDDIEMILKGER